MSSVKYTDSQLDFFQKFSYFMISSNTFGTLTGLGGTGKTFCIKEALSSYSDILYLAPTHKAKEVLAQSIKDDVYTVASFLGITLNENTGKFTVNKSRKIRTNYKILVIDECSMISDVMFSLIKENVKKNKYHNVKVIFMGDHHQLPPIGQITDSITFKYTIATLTERVRQEKTNPIIPLTDIIIDNIDSAIPETRPNIPTKNYFDIKSNKGVLHIDNLDKALKLWMHDYKNSPQSTKFITYNNEKSSSAQSVKNINLKCRSALGYTKEFYVGEVLTAYDNYGDMIFNSCDYFVEEVEEIRYTKNVYIPKTKWKKEFKLDLNFVGYRLTLKNTSGKMFCVNIPCYSHREYTFNKVNEYFEKKEFEIAYSILECIPRLEYGYAITSHKSQGSTYKHVYVCKNNILNQYHGTNRNKNQSLYTACSRASDSLYLIN